MASLPRVSILTANAGGGHLAAAESLAEALADEARVSILRLMDDHTPFPVSRLSAGYGPLVQYAPQLVSHCLSLCGLTLSADADGACCLSSGAAPP